MAPIPADHVSTARALLGSYPDRETMAVWGPELRVAVAQVEATLAVAQQLGRIADSLERGGDETHELRGVARALAAR